MKELRLVSIFQTRTCYLLKDHSWSLQKTTILNNENKLLWYAFSLKPFLNKKLFGMFTFLFLFYFFSISVFFQKHSLFTGQQGMDEGIFLTPLYHFHPLHRHWDVSRGITAESLPLQIVSSQTRTGNRWFRAQIANDYATRP